MKVIDSFYNKLMTNLIEKAQANEWWMLDPFLQSCKQEQEVTLIIFAFVSFSIVYILRGLFIRRTYLSKIINLTPSKIELKRFTDKPELNITTNEPPKFAEPHKQVFHDILTPPQGISFAEEDSYASYNGSNLIVYRDTCHQLDHYGFQQGAVYKCLYKYKLYEVNALRDFYLTPFFKQGVCVFITHNFNDDDIKFGMIAIMDNAKQVLSLSTEKEDTHLSLLENYQAILMDENITVKEGLDAFIREFNQHPYKHQLTHLNDDNFAEYYELVHEELFTYLKSLSYSELKVDG